jgi:hypothetical protein
MACALLAIVLTFAPSANAAFTLIDDFEYSDWNTGDDPATANWSRTNGSGTPLFVEDLDYHGSTYMRLPGCVITRSLGQTISGDWSLSIDAIIMETSATRFFWIGLLDSEGKTGYGFYWEGGATTNTQGNVRLSRYDVPTNPASLVWNTYGIGLGSIVTSGYTKPAADPPPTVFATFELTWEASSGTLTLAVNGLKRSSVVDTTFSSFSSVFMGANDGVRIDNLNITAVPEPATIAAILGVVALLAVCARTKITSR